jgi:hypothetical protein
MNTEKNKLKLNKLEPTSPVTSSHNKPSGNGSPPLIAAGNFFWHSGIESPLNLIPYNIYTHRTQLVSHKLAQML